MRSDKVNLSHIPWILLLISLFSLYFKPSGSHQIVSLNLGNAFRIATVMFAVVIGVFQLLKTRLGVLLLFRGPLGLLFLYSILAVISGGYASHGYYAIWKSLEILAGVIATASLLTADIHKESLVRIYNIAITFFYFLVVSFYIGIIFFPSQAFSASRGILKIQLWGVVVPMNPNGLAFVCAFISLISLVRCYRATNIKIRIFFFLSLVLALPCLVLAQSRTSIGGFVVGLIVYLFLDRRFKTLFFIVLISLMMFSVGAIKQTTVLYIQRGQSKQLAMSLSGRTVAWKGALREFEKSPYLGNGFASAGRFDVLKGGSMSTLHGSVFDVLVGVGIIGFIPWLGAVVFTVLRLLSRKKNLINGGARSFYAELNAVMFLILVRSTTSSELALHGQTFLLFLILVAFASTRQELWLQSKEIMVVGSK